MSQNKAQEKTEQATPKRLRDAQKKGQLPRSKDLNSMAIMVTGSSALIFLGKGIAAMAEGIMRDGLTFERELLHDDGAMIRSFAGAVREALLGIAPFLGICMVAALGAPALIGGWSFSLESLAFKPEKLDPIKGFGRLFALRNLVELFKAMAKFLVVAIAAVILLRSLADELLGLGREPILTALVHGLSLALWSFLIMSAVLLLIAAVDVPFQLWDHSQKMKMTKQEVRDESKETDGRPEVKARIRQTQQEMARGRMMHDVPTADVVVTNPTHFAVALRYDQAGSGAPVVVAKGADLVAGQIRKIADAHAIPLFEAPPLARALYANTPLGQEIPAALYVAVAQVLSYVYQLRRAVAVGDATPTPPTIDFDETAAEEVT